MDHLAQDRDQCRALVNTVTINFSSMTLLQPASRIRKQREVETTHRTDYAAAQLFTFY
jgi:hypothetical protein